MPPIRKQPSVASETESPWLRQRIKIRNIAALGQTLPTRLAGVTVGEMAKVTAEAAKGLAGDDLQIKSLPDCHAACNNLRKLIEDTDIVLVKGSRSNRLEGVVEKLKQIFG